MENLIKEEYKGILEYIIFLSDDKSYAVAEFVTEDNSFVVCGFLPDIAEQLEYKISGNWRTHPKYGKQFIISEAILIKPETEDAIYRYLSSGIISGIGEHTASLIVKKFGKSTFDIIEKTPEKLLKVKGIGKLTLKKIVDSYKEQEHLKSNMIFFQKIGITNLMGGVILKELGPGAPLMIQENPYILSDRVWGLGFKKADQIAMNMGIEINSDIRAEALIIHLLNEDLTRGHTYSIFSDIISKMLENGISKENAESAIYRLDFESKLYFSTEPTDENIKILTLKQLENIESEVAHKILELVMSARSINCSDNFIDLFEKRFQISFDDIQKEAINLAKSHGVYIITGGPGTGKTTIIKALINLYESANKKVALCAPTGRAAKRMALLTDRKAKTIHRLLESNGQEFNRNKENPISEDVIIVDEVSMIDVFLMHRLLSAIKSGSSLVLVGDKDQLPSVGAGSVLRDLLCIEEIKSVKLQTIFRQNLDSSIASNAHLINNGEMPIFNDGRDFYFIDSGIDECGEKIVDIVTRRLPKKYGFNPISDIEVLGLKYKSLSGVNHLNELLQSAINPLNSEDNTSSSLICNSNEYINRTEIKIGVRTFRLFDKVMQIANNYEIEYTGKSGSGSGVFNGDIGIISMIDKDLGKIQVTFDDDKVAEYDISSAMDLVRAYAITVHKSQGSEFPCVVMPIFYTWGMMYRNLLYTAITRAKELVVLVGDRQALKQMIDNIMIDQRRSKLAGKIRELIDAYR